MVLKQLFPWLPRQCKTYRAHNKSQHLWFGKFSFDSHQHSMNMEAKMILIVDTDKQTLRRIHWLVWSHTVRGSEVFLDLPSVPSHHTTSFQKRELFFFFVLGNLCSNKISPGSMNKYNTKKKKKRLSCLLRASIGGPKFWWGAVYFPYQEQLEHCIVLHSLLNSSRK